MSKFILISEKKWHDTLFESLKEKIKGEWLRIKEKDNFNLNFLKSYSPEIVFIPHWSYIIPHEIYNNFNCIVFHMTDLPFGRGGSPLQNLIIRGHTETKISAIKVTEGIDTGDVYLKENLSLAGSAEEIFVRASKVIERMAIKIIEENLKPVPQEGEPLIFKRRSPKASNLQHLEKLEDVYDYIRMLDAEGYPHAFIETEHFHFEFTRASIKTNNILADVRIIKK